MTRVQQTSGMTADWYFKEASKLALSGDLANGIESLKKGLLLKPNHFLCRFNHGVLMFKFGLIKEATQDFESIIKNNPKSKELAVFFNHAICLTHLEIPKHNKNAADQ